MCVFLRDTHKNPGPSPEDRREAIGRLPVAIMGVLCPFQALESAKAGPAFFCWTGQIQKEVPRMAKAGNRVKIVLRCSECKQRNYNTKKNKRNTTERLELNKYCPFCRKHTLHTETK